MTPTTLGRRCRRFAALAALILGTVSWETPPAVDAHPAVNPRPQGARYGWGAFGRQPASPVPTKSAPRIETLHVAGLREPVEVLRDRWGIRHVYARNEDDLFFAQGFCAARDRLFQLEMWRRRATGTLAEVLGRRALDSDIGSRLHRYRGNLAEELRMYHPRGEAIVGAFVRGINAYIGETERRPELLPVEFEALGFKPGRWTPEVVISRHQALASNLQQEIDFARALHVMGADRLREVVNFQGADPGLALDAAIDRSALTDDITRLYHAFRRAPRFVAEDVVPRWRASRAAASHEVLPRAIGLRPQEITPNPHRTARSGAAHPPIEGPVRLEPEATYASPEEIGSNNWVMAGRLTTSGKPMMMNDPHREQAIPSLRYWAHLNAPGWNVIGAGEPSLPGVSIGHNDHGAWGLTIFGTDTEDLYVYETNPANPLEYRYQNRWDRMTVARESIAVEGEPPVSVDLKYTRHGPVLHEEVARHRAYALRAAWLEPGGAPYLASLRMNQASTWEEFRDACTFSRMPAENMVWAGRDGTIGYQAVAITPIRRNWSGLLPVPGDGRYEWDGFLPIRDLPNSVAPERGFWVTANHYLLPEKYSFAEFMPRTWAEPWRALRIEEALASGRRFGVADMARLQNDDLSLPARSLVPLLRDLPSTTARVDEARRRLLAWDFVLDRDSVAAGIYERWQRRLLQNVRDVMVPKAAQSLLGGASLTKTIAWLYAPDGRFGGDPLAGRDALLLRSLEDALNDLQAACGAEPSAWTLGCYHHARIAHPLAEAVNDELRARLTVGPVPRGGDAFTVTATGSTDRQTSGGSFKIITETADWDASIGLNNPGQSGNPADAHFRDLFDLWATGRYFPIFFSRPKIESVTEEELTLDPRS